MHAHGSCLYVILNLRTLLDVDLIKISTVPGTEVPKDPGTRVPVYRFYLVVHFVLHFILRTRTDAMELYTSTGRTRKTTRCKSKESKLRN